MIQEEKSSTVPENKEDFTSYYNWFRKQTESLAAPLEKEDYMLQAMTDASPTKWHLAHVSWFFEAFILKNYVASYKPLNDLYNYLFNSYYQDVGKPFQRPMRGQISRPTVNEVYEFRKFIDESMISLIDNGVVSPELRTLLLLGGNHEQQHQELILTDLKYNLSINPLYPAYKKTRTLSIKDNDDTPNINYIKFGETTTELGYHGEDFAFDNELPVHKQLVNSFKLANRLTTNGEYLRFIESGGYKDHRYWLSEGWDRVQNDGWNAPLHWHKIDDEWFTYTLAGLKPLNLSEPVTHVSYFEADAFAKFEGKRLPTEVEWEFAVKSQSLDPEDGNYVNTGLLHPKPLELSNYHEDQLNQMFGDVWEWTGSAYLPYPGFSVLAEGISEYNGKFMSSQFVLRGGSCVTPEGHVRESYRNFWHPHIRFQFSGIRLAE